MFKAPVKMLHLLWFASAVRSTTRADKDGYDLFFAGKQTICGGHIDL
jgi:hypothetical protein